MSQGLFSVLFLGASTLSFIAGIIYSKNKVIQIIKDSYKHVHDSEGLIDFEKTLLRRLGDWVGVKLI